MRYRQHGFTLIECMIAVFIAAVLTIGTLSLLAFARSQNELEQQRARAHQIVSQTMEILSIEPYNYVHTLPPEQIIWDNGTPLDHTDDTVGSMTVTVKDVRSGDTLTTTPVGYVPLMSIETTLSWSPRSGPSHTKTLRETAMMYKVP